MDITRSWPGDARNRLKHRLLYSLPPKRAFPMAFVELIFKVKLFLSAVPVTFKTTSPLNWMSIRSDKKEVNSC